MDMFQKIQKYSFTIQIIVLSALLTLSALMVYRFFKADMIRGVSREEQNIESLILRTYAREYQRIGLLIQSLQQMDVSDDKALAQSINSLMGGYGPDGQIPSIISGITSFPASSLASDEPVREGEFQIRTVNSDKNLPPVSILRYSPPERPDLLIQLILDRDGMLENYIKPAVEESLEEYNLQWITLETGREISDRRDERKNRDFPFRPLAALTGWPHNSGSDLLIPLPDEFENHRPFIPADKTEGGSDRSQPDDGVYRDRVFDVKPDFNPFRWSDKALVLGFEDAPYYRDIERKAALTWLLSNLILLGTALVFLTLILQMKRLKTIRSREKEFVSSMTHELRTPLTVIQSAADNLSKGIIPPDRVARYGLVMKDQVGRLGGMIEEILLFSSMEGNHSKPREQVDLHLDELLKDLETGVNSLAEDRGVSLHWDAEGFPPGVKSYPDEIKLILNNLIGNALHHGAGSPVRIRVVCRSRGTIVATVEDDGSGIPPREQKYVFDPFYRTLLTREKQTRGSGLGLHISLKKTKLLGGTLKLESPYERLDGVKTPGCRFTLTVPCSFQAEEDK